ncbi:MAG: mannose-1-phosphate guanylyltransferase, partial [Bacteroidetes bacterium RIFOXYA12_FULL_35_11]
MNRNNIVSINLTIISALKLMDEKKCKLLFIVESDNKFIGVLSLGDLQRAIINQKSLETPIKDILRKLITVANTQQSFDEIKQVMLEKRVEAMPVIDSKGYLVKVVYWEDIIGDETLKNKTQINLPVVIMAGGQGQRLKPLTNVIPKPLFPIGENTIIEEILESFIEYGCDKFFLSVNYKSDIIKYYIENQVKQKYNISYLEELKPLGTAGSLQLLKDVIKETFFVTNCDILINQDYSEILKYHRENNNELTVVAALKNYSIPYGTIETGKNGVLDSITEKPEITFKINTGFYILEPHLISEIPQNTFFH